MIEEVPTLSNWKNENWETHRRPFIDFQCQFITEHWFPHHISVLDKCNHLVTKFEPELDRKHPGWRDIEYRNMRTEIEQIALNYQQ